MIEFIRETGSTNADLAGRLRSGEAVREGHWLVADRQIAGRGRQGREWLGGAGNFMGSTLIRREHGDPPAPSLALLAGIALVETVSPMLAAQHRVQLKWPNDLMIVRAKLAGILLEAHGDVVIVGIGVNLASAPEVDGRETIALSSFGPAPDRDSFAAALAAQFCTEVDRWRTYGLGPIIARWLAAGHPPGTLLSIGGSDGDQLTGTFTGLSDDGALQLSLPGGTTRTIHAGEVQFAAS